jgi:hypothetical protein
MAQGFLFARPDRDFVDLVSDLRPTIAAQPGRAMQVPAVEGSW